MGTDAIARGGSARRASRVTSCRNSSIRFSCRWTREPNQGSITGLRTVNPCLMVARGRGGRDQVRILWTPRRRVAQSKPGGRVPIVFTHRTSWRSSMRRMRCWQLEGWRPQSSAKTSSGAFWAWCRGSGPPAVAFRASGESAWSRTLRRVDLIVSARVRPAPRDIRALRSWEIPPGEATANDQPSTR